MAIPFAAESWKVVNLVPPVSLAGGKAVQYVSLANYAHVDLVLMTGAVTSAASTGITFQRALNTSGDSVQTVTAPTQAYYYHNGAAISSASIANDTYVKTTLTAGTFTLQAIANTAYIIPIDADDINRSLSSVQKNFNTVGITIDSSGGATIGAVLAILSQPRYSGANAPSAV